MTQALVQINGVTGSNTDLPINTLVTLTNVGNGGELTYNWSILDQPAGTADVLASATSSTATFTPRKEGTYLLRLVVNQGLGDQATQQVVAAVRQLKTRLRVPAAGETVEANATLGWEVDANVALQRLDQVAADAGLATVVAGSGGLTVGMVVQVTATATIKSGLPGQEVLPSVVAASSATLAGANGRLAIVVGRVGGGTINNGDLVQVRTFGLAQGVSLSGAVVGNDVYLGTAGAVSLTPGTVRRKVGVVVAVAGSVVALSFNGQDADLAALTAGGDLTGSYPNPTIANLAVTAAKIAAGTITDTQVAAANKDGVAGTASLRTLGTGAQQALAGSNDALYGKLAGTQTFTGDKTFSGATTLGGDVRATSVDNSGTPGNNTANVNAGRCAIAVGADNVVVTNSRVTAASHVFAVVSQAAADATLTRVLRVSPAAGSFTIYGDANATAAVQVDWFVVNP